MAFIDTTFSQLKYTDVFSAISQVTTFQHIYVSDQLLLPENHSTFSLFSVDVLIMRHTLSPHVTETCGSNVAYSEHHMQTFIFSFPYESCCLFFAGRNKVTIFLSRALIHNVWLQGNSRWCSSVIGHSRVSRFSTLHQGGRSRQSL